MLRFDTVGLRALPCFEHSPRASVDGDVGEHLGARQISDVPVVAALEEDDPGRAQVGMTPALLAHLGRAVGDLERPAGRHRWHLLNAAWLQLRGRALRRERGLAPHRRHSHRERDRDHGKAREQANALTRHLGLIGPPRGVLEVHGGDRPLLAAQLPRR